MKAPVSSRQERSFSSFHHRQQGLTLVEMIITIVVISIAVVAVVSAISGTVGRSANPVVQGRSAALAQTYLDEILSKRYAESSPSGGVPAATTQLCDIGKEGSESRSTFNDVDDYDGLDEAPIDQRGVALAGYEGYRVRVSVSCDGTRTGLAQNEAAKLILITVTSPDGFSMAFSAFRANF